MKKVFTVAVLMALSGTAVVAAPVAPSVDLSGLPADIQAKIKSAETATTTIANPIQEYATAQNQQYQQYKAAIETLLEKYPYLKNIPGVPGFLSAIKVYSDRFNKSLSVVQNGATQVGSIHSDLFIIDQLYTGLTQQTFPDVCQTYSGKLETGYILPVLGQKNAYGFYAENDNTKPNFIPFLQTNGTYDVGLLNNGKEVHVPIYSGSQAQAQIMPYGKGYVVVCIGNFIAPSAKASAGSEPAKE